MSSSTDLSFHVAKNIRQFLTAAAHTTSTVHLPISISHTSSVSTRSDYQQRN